jgi:1-acyl-sn-glycerol-3-phosphate acyltransferase
VSAIVAHKTVVYRLGQASVTAYATLVHRLRVRGRERLPAAGGALVVANHASFLDIPFVAAAARRHVAFVARDSLARSRVLAFIMSHAGAILVRRGAADRAAIRAMVAHLEAGDCVAVFPEGERSRDGSVGAFREGALLAARQARVPIVPAAIDGAFRALSRGMKLPRPVRVELEFGDPIEPGDDAFLRARAWISARVDPRR